MCVYVYNDYVYNEIPFLKDSLRWSNSSRNYFNEVFDLASMNPFSFNLFSAWDVMLVVVQFPTFVIIFNIYWDNNMF